jgi:hypothetical protein
MPKLTRPRNLDHGSVRQYSGVIATAAKGAAFWAATKNGKRVVIDLWAG